LDLVTPNAVILLLIFFTSKTKHMKNLGLSLILLFSFMVGASAQMVTSGTDTDRYGKVSASWGVKLGANLSNTSSGYGVNTPANPDVFKDPSVKLGPAAGVFARFHMSNTLRLQPELMYSSEGSLQEGRFGADNKHVLVFRNKLHAINLPVMLQYGFSKGLYLEAGPQIGYLISSKLVNEKPIVGDPVSFDMETNKTFNFSAGAGLGYEFSNGFGLNARYMWGLTENIFSYKSNGLVGAPSMRTNTIHLGAFYRFNR
jgi:hypothetical protein